MKHILLISCLLAAAHTVSLAQNETSSTKSSTEKTRVPIIVPVSKADFLAKINQFDQLANENKLSDAEMALEYLQRMMEAAYRKINDRLENDVFYNKTDDKEWCKTQLDKQRKTHDAIIALKTNIAANKGEIDKKLNEFIDTII